MKEENGYDSLVEDWQDRGADSIYLSNFSDGLVCGEPCDSKTGTTWSMSLISSIEEALECKYKKACSRDDKVLDKILTKNHKKIKGLK